jgi:3-hydroxyisobutyrate dehydrogenase-like beta-hydroxyacid dehydrogenase
MPKKSRKNVGLIGLGIIGSRVANALRLGGYHVYVWNRTPRAAPNFLASPRQVAELCDVIQLFVADAQALFDVLDAMGDSLTPSHIVLCNSTVGPEATLDAARLVQERGAQFLDAPFTGSKGAAQNRELVYYIGGDDRVLKAVEPVLQASSKAIVKIGKIGDAAIIKIATNMISAVTVQTLAEAYAIVKDSGIDPKALSEALKNHAVRSGVTDLKLAKIIERDYEPHFSLKHMFKDVQLGIHIANSLDIDLPATTATAGVMYGGLTRGWADLDFAVLARTYQKEYEAAALPAKQEEALPPIPPLPGVPQAAQEKSSPFGKKEEVLPELTDDDLRHVGIAIPEEPIELLAERKPAGEPKREHIKAETGDFDASVAMEPAAPVAPATDTPVTDVPAVEAGKGATGENGAPGNPPPFVRIRRWFGTGTPG